MPMMLSRMMPTMGGRPGEVPAFPSAPEEVPTCFRQWLGGSYPDAVSRLYFHASSVLAFNEAFRHVLVTLLERNR